MDVYLDGIAVQFFKGIGPKMQFVAPFSKMNFFIGANNSGKSTVLDALVRHLPSPSRTLSAANNGLTDSYVGPETGQMKIAFCSRKEKVIQEIKQVVLHKGNPGRWQAIGSEIEALADMLARDGRIWSSLGGQQNQHELLPTVEPQDANSWKIDWSRMWTNYTGGGGGSALGHWIPVMLNAFAQHAFPKSLPPVHIIPAKRQLGESGESLDDLSGKGVIDHLATLQNPSFDRQDDRERFHRINQFVRDITGKRDAELEVPNDRRHLLVHMDNKVLPLSSLGTGIHEVVLIASFCTIHDGSIMCIEEPEIHLHPLLQKKLVQYLLDETASQYFIATHSSAFIDTKGASVFHVANDGVQTAVNAVGTRAKQRRILDDLGCQPSDILQSNCVIWVEGPSDRIYLRHWLQEMAPSFDEGVHYSIMMYGGALLGHVSTSDDALESFIKLRDLNRNMVVLMDSDRRDAGDKLKRHAQRIVDEMREGDGLVWVTAGREIENYIEPSTMQSALKRLYPKLYEKPAKAGKFDNAFHFMRADPNNPERLKTFKETDKVSLARTICNSSANLSVHDLRSRMEKLVEFIGKANNMDDAHSDQ